MVVRWQLWVIVIADSGRLFAAARAGGRRFESPTLIIRYRPVDGPLEGSPAKAEKTRELGLKSA